MSGAVRKKALQWLLTLKDQQCLKVSAWPSGLGAELDALQKAGVVRISTPEGRRTPHLVVISNTKLDARISNITGDSPLKDLPARAASIHKHGSSKAGDALPYMMLNVLPGGTPWVVGDTPVPLQMGDHCYSGLILREKKPSPQPLGDIILIENRETWVDIRHRLPLKLQAASLIHYEGWLSDRLIKVLKTWDRARIWIAPDYDPVGFHNYFKLKEVRQDVVMLIPHLTGAEIKQWGNEELWAKQQGYLYTVRKWCADNPGPTADFFEDLSRQGVGIEQEFLLGISHLVWNTEQVGRCNDEPSGADEAD